MTSHDMRGLANLLRRCQDIPGLGEKAADILDSMADDVRRLELCGVPLSVRASLPPGVADLAAWRRSRKGVPGHGAAG